MMLEDNQFTQILRLPLGETLAFMGGFARNLHDLFAVFVSIDTNY